MEGHLGFSLKNPLKIGTTCRIRTCEKRTCLEVTPGRHGAGYRKLLKPSRKSIHVEVPSVPPMHKRERRPPRMANTIPDLQKKN
eukprot:2598664-Amphidinium_carterae.2